MLVLFKICEMASISHAIKYSQIPFLVMACRVPVPILRHEMFLFSSCLIAVNRIEGRICGSRQGGGSNNSRPTDCCTCKSRH